VTDRHSDTKTAMATIHFASAMPHAKCNSVDLSCPNTASSKHDNMITDKTLQTPHNCSKCCTESNSTDLLYHPRTHRCLHSNLQQHNSPHAVRASNDKTRKHTDITTSLPLGGLVVLWVEHWTCHLMAVSSIPCYHR